MDDQYNQPKDEFENLNEGWSLVAFWYQKAANTNIWSDRVNEALAQMKKINLEGIITKWTATSSTSTSSSSTSWQPSLDKSTQSELNIRLPMTHPALLSYSIIVSNQYTGIDMDLIKAIAEDQVLHWKYPNPGFDAAINAVQSGQADGMIAGMSVTEARKKTFNFSEPYYTANSIMRY